ncbi:unnamed protein product [Rhizophagus irregularis]|uniref:Uncharacterized protein n=1 Tax=Rhizophagus irregularis TaxID=588596 RepID=A0A916E3J7_9GLOM|nr:unnamed protein product [Rhizophagus irregularis]
MEFFFICYFRFGLRALEREVLIEMKQCEYFLSILNITNLSAILTLGTEELGSDTYLEMDSSQQIDVILRQFDI